MAYDKMKYTNTKQRRQNIQDARTYFNIDLAKEQTILQNDMYNAGIRWFEKGRSLEIAPKTLSNNASFVYGYEFARRRKDGEIFNLGYYHYINGGPLESIPESYIGNKVFKEGYEKAMMDSLENKDVKKGSRR